MFEDAQMEDVETFDLRVHGPSMALSENFQLWEFASRDGHPIVLVHPAIICAIQMVRNHFGVPVTPRSGYRSEAHNAAVGGTPNSTHMRGMAADIVVRGIEPAVVADYVDKELGMGGVGRYDTFTHCDVWKAGRRWNG